MLETHLPSVSFSLNNGVIILKSCSHPARSFIGELDAITERKRDMATSEDTNNMSIDLFDFDSNTNKAKSYLSSYPTANNS
jgi:hypothetical protein